METNVTNSSALSIIDEDSGMIGNLTSSTIDFCSMKAETDAEKAILYNIMNNPEKRLRDCVNIPLKIKDIYVEIVSVTNEKTGEVNKSPRIVLVDDKGIGYQCVSLGVFSALRKIFKVYGLPTWVKPLTIVPTLVNKADRSLLTLAVVAGK